MSKSSAHYIYGYKELLSKKRNFLKFLRHFVKKDCMKHLDVDSLKLYDEEFSKQVFRELRPIILYSARIAGKDVFIYFIGG